MTEIKTIGILTSGGDAPGMNGVIRAVTRASIYHQMRVMGIRRGYHGLWRGDVVELNARSVSETLQRGGTFLMTARSETFRTEEGLQKAKRMCEVFGINVVVCVGGDGTTRGAMELAEIGVPVIVIPATIDNDVANTDYTIGYDTALNTAIESVDRLRDTASSHERCSVIQVMGRSAGYLALNTGIATGAEVILIPEHEIDFDQDVIRKILSARNRGKYHYIVIVAEGAGDAVDIAKRIEEATQVEARATVLGYVQRGGSPTYRDRYMASEMGIHAVECIVEGRLNRAITYCNGEIRDVDLGEAMKMTKTIPEEEFKRAKILSL